MLTFRHQDLMSVASLVLWRTDQLTLLQLIAGILQAFLCGIVIVQVSKGKDSRDGADREP